MNIIVSDLQADDRASWESLFTLYAQFYQMPMTPEVLSVVWSWILDDQNRFFGKIAKNTQGKGLGIMHFREMPSPLRGCLVGFVDDIYVKAEYRGQGVINSIFDSLSLTAIENGWSFVRWITAENNYRARAVYDNVSSRSQWLTYQMNFN